MRKAVKKQPTQATLTADAEPFADVAQRLGNALADVVSHADCPADLAAYVSQFNDNVVNDYSHLALDLRTRFPRAVAEAARENRERPASMAA